MKKKRIGAIDVGTTKVCTIMADSIDGGTPRIIGVGITPSYGMHKGLVVNVAEARESIRQSVREAEKSAGHKLESAYVGITGRHIHSVNNHGAVAITRDDHLVRPDDLKRVLNVARSVKVPSEHELIHIIPRNYLVDGQEVAKNPVGMHGLRLDVETHIITAAVTSIQNLTKCIRSIGVEIDDLVMEPLASAEAILTEEEKLDGVMVADIGGGTTDIAVFKDNSIFHTAVVPVAGYQLTRDISLGLNLSFDLAEEMKKKYGNVLPVSKEHGGQDKPLATNGHSVSYNDLSEIIRFRVEELMRLIMLELPTTDYEKLIPSGLVLTGGSSNLPGIAELAEQITHIPVRIGSPLNLYGVSDALYNPAYATGVGLLFWKNRHEDTTNWQTKRGIRRFMAQLVRLFR